MKTFNQLVNHSDIYMEDLSESLSVSDGSHYTHIEDELFVQGAKAIPKIMVSLVDTLKGIPQTDVQTKIDGCVHGETLLYTNLGLISIEEIKRNFDVGVEVCVLGYDFNLGISKSTPVVNAISAWKDKSWVEITLDNGATIKTTEDHEFYTTNRGWVAAKDLTLEDNIKEIYQNEKICYLF